MLMCSVGSDSFQVASMEAHWARVVLALVCVCAHVGMSQRHVQDTVLCVNSTIGSETNNDRMSVYVLQPQLKYFKINIPKCELGDRVGASVRVCDAKATTTLELENNEFALVYRSGDISQSGRADVVVYCS